MEVKKESENNIDSPKCKANGEEGDYLNEGKMGKRKRPKLGIKLFSLLILVGIVIIIVLKIIRFDWMSALFHGTGGIVSNAIVGQEGTVTTISETSLEEVFEISELTTADYTYNAVAYAYENDGITPKYYVAYDGMVTVGIDFSKISIDVDENNKSITLETPDCEILDTTVSFGSMQYIFEDDKYNTETVSQEAYELCETDLAKRVEKEQELLALAKENATAAVEALVNPWVKQIEADYTVIIK